MKLIRRANVSEIVLTQDQITIVDTCMLDYLSQWKWQAAKVHNRKTDIYYAVRSQHIAGTGHNGKNTKIPMHRQLLTWCGIESETVDHVNGDKLDNRLINLRGATWSQNSINARPHRDNTSGYKGVCWAANKGKWKAAINLNKKRTHLGYFSTAVEAAIAYNKAAREHYGAFAYLNEIV